MIEKKRKLKPTAIIAYVLLAIIAWLLLLQWCGGQRQPEPQPQPKRTLYFCGYDRCRDSGSYGELVESYINVWNGPEPDRGGVRYQTRHGDRAVVVSERRVSPGPGGLWYELEGGGWISDYWLTGVECAPRNMDALAFESCLSGEY